MDDQRGLLLHWTHFYHQEKSTMEDELRQSHLLTVMEMENELKLRDQEISQLKEMIADAIRERDEARMNHQRVLFEKVLLQQQLLLQQHSAGNISSNVAEDDPERANNGGVSSSDSDESIVSSPPPPPLEAEPELPLELINRPLPEKGKLLQAVMKAGPLLQTLLLAGPLPQWRHPPPPLDSYQIPPPPLSLRQDTLLGNNVDDVNVNNNCGEINRKRGLLPDQSCDDSFINELKYQRVVLQ